MASIGFGSSPASSALAPPAARHALDDPVAPVLVDGSLERAFRPMRGDA
jgi:hypothetical protein